MLKKTDHEEQIKQIIKGMECRKGYTCYKSDFVDMCKAKDIGIESFVECLAEDFQDCGFSAPFGYTRFCHCPLRVYLAKQLNK